ncbi:hypothetical protein DUNSADRAFT_13067 [Dunaliella salina]|uniref:EF-hand domain-containing protein n=1 Tax=Dunaliella salina TaxID=3046 RepID=A0ABQ7H3G1_DUNSA|nr:hypothetical protein DUNSADRAFT_13067 [Dunaliella salina]|eukprot:KAF5841404.1 hypothetical protein DUNSADRAFT_13067 [Dunaliella salina]
MKEFDPESTGQVTLEAFLTCCARAGVSMPPDELDALRVAGTLKRPFKTSPELVDYTQLLGLMAKSGTISL